MSASLLHGLAGALLDLGTLQLGGFALLRLFWLAALLPLGLLCIFAVRRAGALAAWDRAIDPPLLAALERLGRVVPGPARGNRLPAITAALIALALVGPAREARDAPSFRNLDGVILVVDLSRSVASGGYLPQALTAARLVAQQAGARPVALVVYAGDGYLASSFTTDATALGTTIAVLDGETVPDRGSRPERGLAVARETLEQAGVLAGDVVLITDGGNLGEAAIREARAIAEAGGRLSTLFVPPVPGPAGDPLPERSLLDALARVGGGVSGAVLDPLPVAEAAAERPAARLAASDYGVLFWTDYGRTLLLLALFPALALFRRRR